MNDYDCCSLNGENAIVKKFRLLIKQSVRDHLDPQTDLYRQSQTDIELLSFMCQHFSVPRTKEQDLSGKVRLYMLANAANPDCTLEKAAEEFGFSSVYFRDGLPSILIFRFLSISTGSGWKMPPMH